jgi:hypothetical protein
MALFTVYTFLTLSRAESTALQNLALSTDRCATALEQLLGAVEPTPAQLDALATLTAAQAAKTAALRAVLPAAQGDAP